MLRAAAARAGRVPARRGRYGALVCAAAPDKPLSHKVVEGDSLYALSLDYGVGLEDLARRNNLVRTDREARRAKSVLYKPIVIGETLELPPGARKPPAPEPAPKPAAAAPAPAPAGPRSRPIGAVAPPQGQEPPPPPPGMYAAAILVRCVLVYWAFRLATGFVFGVVRGVGNFFQGVANALAPEERPATQRARKRAGLEGNAERNSRSATAEAPEEETKQGDADESDSTWVPLLPEELPKVGDAVRVRGRSGKWTVLAVLNAQLFDVQILGREVEGVIKLFQLQSQSSSTDVVVFALPANNAPLGTFEVVTALLKSVPTTMPTRAFPEVMATNSKPSVASSEPVIWPEKPGSSPAAAGASSPPPDDPAPAEEPAEEEPAEEEPAEEEQAEEKKPQSPIDRARQAMKGF